MATKTKTPTRAPQKAPTRPAPQQQSKPNLPATQSRKSSTQIAPSSSAGIPAHLAKKMAADAGKGLSTDQSDNLVPLIYVLQANSPQCMRGHEKQIEGATAGCIWLRNAAPEIQIQDGEEGFDFQPCFFTKDWVEWQPNRGGFVGRHKRRPDVAELQDVEGDDGNVRQMWVMPSGNIVVETRYHVGFVYLPNHRPLPYTIPLSSTGHSVSKAWMFSMNQEQLPSGDALPSFALLYRLRTTLRTKNNNSWYQFTVEKSGFVDNDEDYDRGRALHNAFDEGLKEIEDEGDAVVETGEGDAGDTGEEHI